MLRLTVNGHAVAVEAEPGVPLLWVLRENLGLTGTKYSCGAGHCGACTVLLDGVAVRACQVGVGSVGDRPVTTIEGLAAQGSPVLGAFREEQAGLCGYCLPGVVMALHALLQEKPPLTAEQIEGRLTNLCRCGAYATIRRAVARLVPPALPVSP